MGSEAHVIYRKSDNTGLDNLLKDGFIARSAAMQESLRQIRELGQTRSSVLITGESGTGKEMVARLCHKFSQSPKDPFVAVNCAALPSGLFESELFGHKRGSFTGAVAESEGLIRKAHGGTLFLDEIGDMPLNVQAKLLRVVQDRRVRPVGGQDEISVDVRIVAATHKNLMEACDEGTFRSDLYFRLSVVPIFIPPLKQRRDDIIPLAKHQMNRISILNGKPPKAYSPEAQERLLENDWPGNVRELNNVVERAIVYSRGSVIHSGDIVFDSQFYENMKVRREERSVPCIHLKTLEKMAITEALRMAKGVKSEAARRLGIDRKTLRRKEVEYQIDVG